MSATRSGDEDARYEDVRALHARVDAEAAALAREHAARLVCARGCSACCVDDLTVFAVEARRIEREFPAVLAEAPHPPGACAFLDAEGACRVYAARPYVCRTQRLPLAHFHERPDGDVGEERSICALNAEGPPLASLALESCWLIGPVELELQRLQQRAAGDQRRVALRALFEHGGEGTP